MSVWSKSQGASAVDSAAYRKFRLPSRAAVPVLSVELAELGLLEHRDFDVWTPPLMDARLTFYRPWYVALEPRRGYVDAALKKAGAVPF